MGEGDFGPRVGEDRRRRTDGGRQMTEGGGFLN